MRPFCRKKMAKRSSCPPLGGVRKVKKLLRQLATVQSEFETLTRDIEGYRSEEEEDEQPQGQEEQTQEEEQEALQSEGTSSPTTEEEEEEVEVQQQQILNQQHLIAMIRCHQEDDLGLFFASILSTVRQFSRENVERLQQKIQEEMWRIDLGDFLDNLEGTNRVEMEWINVDNEMQINFFL